MINDYYSGIKDISDREEDEIIEQAVEYNRQLAKFRNDYKRTRELQNQYDSLLNLTSTGIMGVIDIPKISVSLPIYHGTAEKVLQVAVGHIDWSSLPVGGESSHCVVSGHRGLPRSKLFTDLDRLREGDTFTLTIIDEVLTYEIDQIRIVEPDDIDDLGIFEGQDYCTLVTCTPYSVNTHRLLVRGHRVETVLDGATVVADAVKVDPMVSSIGFALPLIFILLMIVIFQKPPKKDTMTNLQKAEAIANAAEKGEI